nr:retrovirus-related Pol polyprotein from transposon TNT 1-94 [Tanacetum cinerariifolium]
MLIQERTTKEITRRGRVHGIHPRTTKKTRNHCLRLCVTNAVKKGHIKRYCKNPKKKNQNSNKKDESANAVEQVDTTEITAMVSELNIGMIQELHMASVTTTNDWWYDSGATTHVCNNRDLFKTYKETEDGHEVMMGDNHTSRVIGSGNVEIQFTFGKNPYESKMKRKPFPKVDRQSEMLELVHSDICELNGQLTRGGNRTKPYTPQQNGVAKRKNRVLQDIINAMLVSENLPKNLWGGALLTACHRCRFFENKFRHDSTRTNEIVTQIPQDISGLNLNSFNKMNMVESFSAPRKSERARKERNLDPGFIDSLAIIFLVEGDNKNNVVNKIPVLLNVKDAPKTYKEVPKQFGIDGYLELNTIQMDPFKLLKQDDILIVGTNMEGINETKKFLSLCFQMKDMNEEANTTYESSCKLVENNGRAVAQIEYASAIDASWITGSSDSKSTTGWIFTLGGGAVCWGSKKQTCITHSTMKAEFLAPAAACKEAEWLRNIFQSSDSDVNFSKVVPEKSIMYSRVLIEHGGMCYGKGKDALKSLDMVILSVAATSVVIGASGGSGGGCGGGCGG